MLIFSRENYLLFSVLLVSFVIQMCLWFGSVPYPDNEYWAGAANQIAHGVLPSFSSFVPAHPATTILLPAAALILLGVPTPYAIPITMVVLISLSITLSVYLLRTLRPQSLWWLGAAALLIPNPEYLKMTIPTALAALLSGVYILLILRIREKSTSREIFLWLGICAGILLATRIDVGVEMLLVSIPYLWWHVRQNTFYILASSALCFILLNPFVWAGLTEYVASFVDQIRVHVVEQGGFGYPIFSIALPIATLFIGILFACIRPKLSSLPRDFLLWLIVSSVAVCAVIFLSPFHPVRYFFPIITIAEIFLPLLLFDAFARADVPQIAGRIRIEYVFITLFVAQRGISMYILWL